ncbi:MAG TPA: YfiR family protein [Ramlibacter sp.]|nr:YfiR family protein [Ramlibacter sp.]
MTARAFSRKVVCLALWLAQTLAVQCVWAQSAAPPESAVKAAFLFKFAAFIEWPPGTFQRADQPLVIGISDDDDIADDLEQLTRGRTAEGRPVSIRRVAEGSAAAGVHILFISQRRDTRLKDAIDAVAGPVLIVTEQPGALRLGSVINFTTESGRVRFSASLTSAEARNLKLSARLLAVAQSIEGRVR